MVMGEMSRQPAYIVADDDMEQVEGVEVSIESESSRRAANQAYVIQNNAVKSRWPVTSNIP
jgi:hypothetical protein